MRSADTCTPSTFSPRRSTSGEPFPVAAALDALAALSSGGGELLWGDSPDGLLWALGVRSAGGATVLAANIGTRDRSLDLETPAGRSRIHLPSLTFVRTQLP